MAPQEPAPRATGTAAASPQAAATATNAGGLEANANRLQSEVEGLVATHKKEAKASQPESDLWRRRHTPGEGA